MAFRNSLALCMGNNYTGTAYELSGCIRDATNMKNYFIKTLKFKSRNVWAVHDGTRARMMYYLRRIVRQANRSRHVKTIFITYSGHGSFVRDRNRDESDGNDEVIVPNDFTRAGLLTDDWLFAVLRKLKRTIKCVCVFDCCNSGTVLDLQYVFQSRRSKFQFTKSTRKRTASNIICLSACRDDQLAVEIYTNQAQGLLTTALLMALRRYGRRRHNAIRMLNYINQIISHNKFTQVTQLTSSRWITTKTTIF